MPDPSVLLVVSQSEVVAPEVGELPVLPVLLGDANDDGDSTTNPLKFSENILPVKIGCVTIDAVLDTGVYANMVSRDFYDKICLSNW